jgi:serine protease AprX
MLSATLVAGLAAIPAGAVAQQDPAEGAALQKVIVKFDDDVTPLDLEALAALGVQKGFEIRSIDAVAVTALPNVIGQLADVAGVVAVQPQRKIELHLYASKEQIKAHTITEPGTYEGLGGSFDLPGYDGTGVTVGVIDSGIFSEHPGLAGKVTAGLNFEFTEVQDQGVFTVEQWDTYAETTGPSALQDEVGHGTHVAGTIGGTGAGAATFSEEELAGVAPGAEFVSLKIASAGNGVFDDFGFEENAMFAIDYLIRHPELGVTITNNSWGLLPTEPDTVPIEDTDYDASNEMVDAATAAGITMVFSAGNDGPEPGTIRPGPGAGDAILVAAACKSVDSGRCEEGEVIAGFSSRGAEDGTGPQVDVTAPGDTIMAPVSPASALAALTECPRPEEEPLYYCISGTSMASPHIAGVVALMQQANPDLTPAEAEACLVDTADDLLDEGFDIHSGHGMADTPEAIACALDVAATVDDTVTPAPAPEPAEEPAPVADTALPTTGGGLALVGLLGLAGARALRRR